MPRTLALLLLCTLLAQRASGRKLLQVAGASYACVNAWNAACPQGQCTLASCPQIQAMGTNCLVELAVQVASEDMSGGRLNQL